MRFLLLTMSLLSSFALGNEPTEPAAPPPPWASSAEASVLLTSGNTEFTTIGAAVESLYKVDPWAAKGRASYLQNTSAGTTQAQLFTLDARGDRVVSGLLSTYLQAGFLTNRFAGFNSRTNADAGLNYAFIRSAEHTLSTELGLGLVVENRTDIAAGNTFVMTKLGAEYKWKISPSADFATQVSVLENLKTTNDLRVSSVTSMTFVMTKVFSTKFSFRLDFLNSPVTGKKNTDTATTVALVAKF